MTDIFDILSVLEFPLWKLLNEEQPSSTMLSVKISAHYAFGYNISVRINLPQFFWLCSFMLWKPYSYPYEELIASSPHRNKKNVCKLIKSYK